MTGFRFSQRMFMDSHNYQRMQTKLPSGRWILSRFKIPSRFGWFKNIKQFGCKRGYT